MTAKLIYICLILWLVGIQPVPIQAQTHRGCSFCKAVEKGRFHKVERKFRRQVRIHRHGTQVNNTYYIHDDQVGQLVRWLSAHSCVAEATQERCAIHILIYPGWTYIGARFKTRDSIVEKVFHIQMGKIHYLRSRIMGLRICFIPKLKTESEILVYKGMADSPGFCEQQRLNCIAMKRQDSADRREYLRALSLSADTSTLKMQLIDIRGGGYINQYGNAQYNYRAVAVDHRPDKGINKGDTLALTLNLSKEVEDWLKNWKDPRPPMGWEILSVGNTYVFILNNTIPPEAVNEKGLRNHYLFGGANCISLP